MRGVTMAQNVADGSDCRALARRNGSAFRCDSVAWCGIAGQSWAVAHRANQKEEVAVIARKLSAAVLGACLGAAVTSSSRAQDAASPLPAAPRTLSLADAGADAAAPNQKLADAVAGRLRQSGLPELQVDITARAGIVELAGRVATTAQHAEVIHLARSVPGVLEVRDRLQVRGAGAVQTTQALAPPAPLQPGLAAPQVPAAPGAPWIAPPPAGGPSTTPPAIGPRPGEPLPIFQAPPGPNPNLQPPPLPPNAWPTFAPYNNYSRVAYPTLYPYEAWPFIGPFYPFPRVPLGWRSVSLTWQDGHWWYGKNATGHDWWRVRYW
jgi:hypothetical protein